MLTGMCRETDMKFVLTTQKLNEQLLLESLNSLVDNNSDNDIRYQIESVLCVPSYVFIAYLGMNRQ